MKNLRKLFLICTILLCNIFPLTVSAASSTIQKEPKQLVILMKKEIKGIATWEPKIKTMIDKNQLYGNHAISYYRFSGNKNCKSVCSFLMKDVKVAKAHKQFPSDVFYLHYDGKRKVEGKTVHQYSLYQTTREVLANPKGIPERYRKNN